MMAKAKDKKSPAKAAAKVEREVEAAPKVPRLWQRYREKVIPALMAEFNYKNAMEVPTIDKIVLNMGLGEAVNNSNLVKTAVQELSLIAGQKAVMTRAKKAIANFKLRIGLPIGCMVTLRRERMWEFLDRLVSIALPRVRDFKGVNPKAFDGLGNYSLGLKEQIIFPEINYDNVDKIKGFNIAITTTAKTDAEGRALLKSLGVPFRN